MKNDKKSLIFITLGILGFVSFQVSLASAVFVSGNAIGWDNLERLDGTLVKVYKDSQLISQVVCGPKGSYQIDLNPGNYMFIAIYIDGNGGKYLSEANLTIYENQTTNIDFLMIPAFEFPNIDEYDIPELDINFTDFEGTGKGVDDEDYNGSAQDGESVQDGGSTQDRDLTFFIALMTVLILIGGAGFALHHKRKQKPVEGLSEDEQKIINILNKKKQVLQSDLVRELNVSPAKTSLLITELENKGLVKREVRGRTNMITRRE